MMKDWFYGLSSREQKLFIATAAAAIIGGLYIGGSLLLSSGPGTEVSEATASRFEDVLQKIDSIDQQKTNNGNLKKRLGNESGKFVDENGVSKITSQLYQTAGQSGVQLKVVSPNINQRAKPYPSVDVRMSFECQFNQLIQFLTHLKKADIILQPQSMKMQLQDPNQPKLDVQMTVTTYLLKQPPQQGARS